MSSLDSQVILLVCHAAAQICKTWISQIRAVVIFLIHVKSKDIGHSSWMQEVDLSVLAHSQCMHSLMSVMAHTQFVNLTMELIITRLFIVHVVTSFHYFLMK